MGSEEKLFRIEFYVPLSHLEAVKLAMFAVGAGRQGAYENCCWQTLGQGQFRPLAGSQPYIGEQGELETLEEYKVEMVCRQNRLQEAVLALRTAHPYEEPAFSVFDSQQV